ncbi:MAG: hypothetical protein QOK14_548, partial [Frankiaceae bacterium]|nr:hypothetical protein [Frankiaceae bacterium]
EGDPEPFSPTAESVPAQPVDHALEVPLARA